MLKALGLVSISGNRRVHMEAYHSPCKSPFPRWVMVGSDESARTFTLEDLMTKEDEEWHSKAVIASDGGDGRVLWYVGGSLRASIDEGGVTCLADLGLDDAPHGISVWEGSYIWSPGGYEYPEDGNLDPSGKFRAPNDAEWEYIKEGKNPWM